MLPCLVPLFLSASLVAQSPAQQRCAAFGKGQNISNWLEAYWNGNWPSANGYTKKDLEDMKAAGTSSIFDYLFHSQRLWTRLHPIM
ncbi:MAG: hypothetical protein IPH78_15085 [Bacteroidetes bacterium]|nr:hypothetical protein [Bacteroidota bacterium]